MRRLASSIVLTISLAACQIGADPSFEVRLPSPGEGISPLDVVVVDHAGVVPDVEGVATADWNEGISRSDRPGQMIVGWLGGLCDARTTLSVASDAGTLTIREATESTGSGCLLMGVPRSVGLDLNWDFAPETIRLVSEGGG